MASSPKSKPHPVPWSHDETISLIRLYQHKWYSLKRGPLKASQWDEVASSLSKTGTQCRHKIEKLRKRYRSEKLRPNPSSWIYFDLMRQLDLGPLPISVALPVPTLNRQPDFDDDDDDEDDEDFAKRRRIEQPRDFDYGDPKFRRCSNPSLPDSRVSADPRLDQYGDPKSRHCSNPSLADPRFQKNKHLYDEDDEEEEEEETPTRRSEVMLGELAMQMRGFAERFMKMERKKMDVMRETERCRMEMENKRMEMILVAQQKTVDMISRAFAASPSPSPSSSSQSEKKLQVGS